MTTEGPIQVAAGADDAWETDAGGNFTSASSVVAFNRNTGTSRKNGGFKFDSVAIANGDTIDSVDMQVNMKFSGDTIDCDILANDVDSAADFSSEADVTSRTRTSASASWGPVAPSSGVRGSFSDDAVDARAVVQEVVDRGGWSSNNDMVILLDGVDASFTFCDCHSYDGNSSKAAKLTIDFTGGGGGPTPNGSLRLMRGAGK